MIRYDIKPGHGRLSIVALDDGSIELTVGVSETFCEIGSKPDNRDGFDPLFSIVIHNPKTARVFAENFAEIAETMEYIKGAI